MERRGMTQAPISPIINLHTSLPALFSRDRRGSASEKCLWQQLLELNDMASERVCV